LEIITLAGRVNGFLRPSELHPDGCSCKALTWPTRQCDPIVDGITNRSIEGGDRRSCVVQLAVLEGHRFKSYQRREC